MTAEYRTPAGVLRAEADMIDVTSSLPYADKKWTYTDQAGHQHRYGRGYPTLTWIVDSTYWCEDCRDEHDEGHYECPQCGEHITPGMAGPDLHRKFIPGMTRYYLDDEPITPEEYQRLIAEYQQQP